MRDVDHGSLQIVQPLLWCDKNPPVFVCEGALFDVMMIVDIYLKQKENYQNYSN